jgi:hypothetical protein
VTVGVTLGVRVKTGVGVEADSWGRLQAASASARQAPRSGRVHLGLEEVIGRDYTNE